MKVAFVASGAPKSAFIGAVIHRASQATGHWSANAVPSPLLRDLLLA